MDNNTEIEGYNISITGRHVLVTDAMKKYAFEKMSKIERFSKDLMDVAITMDIQRQEHRVDIFVKVGHFVVKVHASSQDMYASIDKAFDKLSARLHKYKSKMQEHQAKALSSIDMEVNVIRSPFSLEEEVNDAIDEENFRELEEEFSHQIVKKETLPLKTLTAEEAIMKMDLSGEQFLVYRSEEEQTIKVIYRRVDGHYGLIAPQ